MMAVVSEDIAQSEALLVESGLLMVPASLQSRLTHVCIASKRSVFVVLPDEAGLPAVALVCVEALCVIKEEVYRYPQSRSFNCCTQCLRCDVGCRLCVIRRQCPASRLS